MKITSFEISKKLAETGFLDRLNRAGFWIARKNQDPFFVKESEMSAINFMVEKLADITPFDCVCEGVWDGRNVMLGMSGKAVEAFKDNWNATHKKPEEKFGANPWVWVINFEVVK